MAWDALGEELLEEEEEGTAALEDRDTVELQGVDVLVTRHCDVVMVIMNVLGTFVIEG